MDNEFKDDVFFSYSAKDKLTVRRLAERLEADRLRVWLDVWKLLPGQNIGDQLEQALRKARLLVICLSENYLKSKWCMLEASTRVFGSSAGSRSRFFILRLDDTSVPEAFKGLAYADWRTRMRTEDNYARILQACRLGTEQPIALGPRPTGSGSNFQTHADFATFLQTACEHAKRIVLIGTGLAFLNSQLLDKLFKQTNQGLHLEVFLANPFSHSIESRLIEENTGGRDLPLGREGLINRLKDITCRARKLRRGSRFRLRLFSNYPTMALFIVDGKHFTYTYGHRTLGTLSPICNYDSQNPEDKPMIDFLQRQYTQLRESAVDADVLLPFFGTEQMAPAASRRLVSRLVPFAVYIVPTAESDLYVLGSEILGYDLRRSQAVGSPFQIRYRKETSIYGFHLTVADALYLFSDYDVILAEKEVESLSTQYDRFSLTFSVRAGWPTKDAISLVCKDPTGALESLHAELVTRLYRRAAASNYSPVIASASLNRDTDIQRARFMMEKYRAPYILSKFKPHMSLLNRIPASEIREKADRISRLLKSKIPRLTFDVTSLAAMRRARHTSPWYIKSEFKL